MRTWTPLAVITGRMAKLARGPGCPPVGSLSDFAFAVLLAALRDRDFMGYETARDRPVVGVVLELLLGLTERGVSATHHGRNVQS